MSPDRDEKFLADAVRWVEYRLRWVGLGPRPALVAEPDATGTSFAVLVRRLGLEQFEQHLLLLCAANERSGAVATLCSLVPPLCKDHVSLEVARAAFPDGFDFAALGPDRPLKRLGLVEVNQQPGEGLMAARLWLDERASAFLRGETGVNDVLRPAFAPVYPPWADPPADSHMTAARAVHAALHRAAGDTLPVVQLVGTDGPSKERVAWTVANQSCRALYRVAAEALPPDPVELDKLARAWELETQLHRLALLIDAADLDPDAPTGPDQQGGPPAAVRAALRLVTRTRRLVFLSVRDRWPVAGTGRAAVTFDIGRPLPDEQEGTWVAALRQAVGWHLPDPAEDAQVARATEIDTRLGRIAQALSGEFDLDTGTIRRVARDAPRAKPVVYSVWRNALWDECRKHVRPRLEARAAHLDPRSDWEKLVLPESSLDQLKEIANQVRFRPVVHRRWGLSDRVSRGLGLSVLFAGASGTGKTLAAEVMARDLRLDLFTVDLSAVVSKYIGETEKNLRQVFDAADQGGCVLLFNEADALFGKRSEVKDSHDRYANIQVDYLLQRIEEFRGLAILTTNRRSSIDDAFLRRLRFTIDFPFPDVPQRVAIWKKLLPEVRLPAGRKVPADQDERKTLEDYARELLRETLAACDAWRTRKPPRVIPALDLDYEALAGFPLAGGAAFNAAVNAAFRAAAETTFVQMKHVLPAVRAEMVKERKPFRESDFADAPPPLPSAAARADAARALAAGDKP